MSAQKFTYHTPGVSGWGENPIALEVKGQTFVFATNPAEGTVHCSINGGPLEVIEDAYSHPSGADITPDGRIRAIVEVGDSLEGMQSYLNIPEEGRRVKLPVPGSNDMIAIRDSEGGVMAFVITAIGTSLMKYASTHEAPMAPLTFVRPGGGDPFVTTARFSCPNGIDVTYDGKRLLVALSHENRLISSRIIGGDSVIEDEFNEFVRFDDGPEGMPDGIATYSDGVAVALPYASKAVIVDNDGEVAREVYSPNGELVVATAIQGQQLYAVLTVPGSPGDMFNGTWRIGVTDL